MRTEMKPSENIFRALGKLFYAIAAVDHRVHLQEFEILGTIISKEHFPDNNKEATHSTNSSEIIESFYSILQEKIPAYDAFKEFVSYKQANEHEFSPQMKKWIWKIADKICYSFAAKNKSEVIILSKLKSTLQE